MLWSSLLVVLGLLMSLLWFGEFFYVFEIYAPMILLLVPGLVVECEFYCDYPSLSD